MVKRSRGQRRRICPRNDLPHSGASNCNESWMLLWHHLKSGSAPHPLLPSLLQGIPPFLQSHIQSPNFNLKRINRSQESRTEQSTVKCLLTDLQKLSAALQDDLT